jgi:hypothetical protein
MLGTLLILIAVFILLVAFGLIALRMMSRKCPYCEHYTMNRRGKTFICSNGHCGAQFTDDQMQGNS